MNPVFLYDGVCGLCNRLVQFVLRRDRRGTFRFAALQSDFARAALAQHGIDATGLDTMYVLTDADTAQARVLGKAAAVLFVLRELGGIWRVLALAGVLPAFVLDALYNLVARHRYRIFGRSETCMLPPEGAAERFLDGSGAPSRTPA